MKRVGFDRCHVLYILTSIWVLQTPNMIQICLFIIVYVTCQKRKKKNKIEATFRKKRFVSLHTNACRGFFSGNKTINQRMGANFFLLHFTSIFLLFIPFFGFFPQNMLKKHISTAFELRSTQILVE